MYAHVELPDTVTCVLIQSFCSSYCHTMGEEERTRLMCVPLTCAVRYSF